MAIELIIIEPENNQFFTGSPNVNFVGSAEVSDDLAAISFFYRWYSSLYVSDQEEQYSMNVIANSAADSNFSHQLELGTHVITFAASDVAGESADDFSSIENGGVTGGNEGDGKCVIHVFIANQLLPLDNTSISRVSIQLEAEAPSQWGMADDIDAGTAPFVINEDYHALNRLQYRWLFEPVGAPSSRPTLEFIPNINEMTFVPKDAADLATIPTRISATTTLPSDALGNYNITLFVEDNQAESTFVDSDQIMVTFI